MPHTQHSPSKSRRDLAASLRGSRPRKQARLRYRRLQAERLEDRQLLATISGAVFNDLNADGVKNTGESGQSGWTVYLDADGSGQLDTGEITATTAADGSYSFNDLVAGTYTVAEVQQPGWQQTSPVGSIPSIERVSVAFDGSQGDNTSSPYGISADGRYVAFYSMASNLVPGDTNGTTVSFDVFVYDRQTDMTQRVSVASGGTQGNGSSMSPSISADGHFVAFNSAASNLVPDDTNGFTDAFVTANPFAWASGSQVVALAEGQYVSGINFGNASPTKFYVVDDASQNLTYEYTASGQLNETYSLNTGNTAPRGAASTIAGDKTWVVDANRKVYVYNNSGGLVGSWSLGSLSWAADVQGIATNGTDVWVVDAYSDNVYKYTNAASRITGSQNAASSFKLNSGNKNAADIVTNGTSLWVVNNSTTDKVFKYTTAGALVSSWTITTAVATSPTGITIDPANVSNIWIVDSGTDRVYQYNAAVNFANGSSHTADVSFALAVGNTNPQGIADPPAPGRLLATETLVLAEPVSAKATLRGNDAALENMYAEPLKKFRFDTVRRTESRTVEPHTRDLSYIVGASTNRLANDRLASDKHDTEVDDLFAQWESDPLELLSLPDLGA